MTDSFSNKISAKTAAQQTVSTLQLSIATALFLAVIKFGTGFMTHSMAVWASGLDSLMDMAVSTVNLVAAREAAKPPDENHAYGHGKIESLAGLFQSIFIGLSGLYIIFESLRRWITGGQLEQVTAGMGVMVFAMIITFALTWRIQKVVIQNKSMILTTEKLHFTTDILTNGAVILALLLVQWTGGVFWDFLVSIAVGSYIFKVSFQILRRCIDELLDRSLPPVSKEVIEKMIISHHPNIIGIHEFRSHRVGEKIFMDFHIEIKGVEKFRKAHAITESLISEIKGHYPGADVTVHFDPEGGD